MPIPFLVGLGKCVQGHYFEPEPVLVLRANVQDRISVPQAASAGEFGEAHRQELVSAIELIVCLSPL